METTNIDHHNKGGASGGNNNGFVCRQSSTRWTPTTDQIRILKELYYTNGMRSPSAEQIQRISARLRQYGKIEGKNVFYWFQNHKARERQKKRFTTTTTATPTTNNTTISNSHIQHHNNHNNNVNVMQRNNVMTSTSVTTTTTSTPSAWKPHHHHHHNSHFKYSNNISPGVVSSASVVGVNNGQMGNYPYAYGGLTNMEKAFREQCGSTSGTGANGGSIAHNYGSWVGSVDPYSSSPYDFFDRRSCVDNDNDYVDDDENGDHDDEDDQPSLEIETLPLFPMHGEEINPGVYYSGWFRSGIDGGSGRGHVTARTSLELSLNSYGLRSSPDSLI